MISYIQAVDEIFDKINTAWKANTTSIVGYVPKMRWPGVEEPKKPNLGKYWARTSQETVTEEQTGLRNGDNGQRYTALGLVFVQIFCPKSDGQSMVNGRSLAIVARDALRGKTTSCKVWFRNARIKELSPEDNWYRFNVIAEYEYDEIS